MTKKILMAIICATILYTGLRLRLAHHYTNQTKRPIATLKTRTMHGDEAVNAIKFQKLYFPKPNTTGTFQYDPDEYHGPSLYYLTIPFAWLSGKQSFKATDESLYRSVPLFFSLALIPLSFLFRKELSIVGCAVAGILLIASPAFSFYSRYYIHEMLLVFFTFSTIASGFGYFSAKMPLKKYYAIGLGISLAMMHATKETSIIAWAGFFCGIIYLLIEARFKTKHGKTHKPKKSPSLAKKHLLLLITAALSTWLLFYTSFFTQSDGLLDSLTTYFHYFKKSGANTNASHNQPFWFYHQKLWSVTYGKMVWSEKLILIGAACGLILAFLPFALPKNAKPFARFIAIYSLTISLIYCTLPYKTTWSMLTFLHSYILLCAVATHAFLHMIASLFSIQQTSPTYHPFHPRRVIGYIFQTVLCVALFFPIQNLYQTASKTISKKYESHKKNPYCLGQPLNGAKKLGQLTDQLAKLLDKDQPLIVYLNLTPGPYSQLPWPLPWYLRKHITGYQILYQNNLPRPHLFITDERRASLLPANYQKNYQTKNYGIFTYPKQDKSRNGLITAYIQKDLYQKFLDAQ